MISNLRAGDQAPPSSARTRHHNRVVGNELVVYVDALPVALATSGAENECESSISIV